jgi:hypothetical protein
VVFSSPQYPSSPRPVTRYTPPPASESLESFQLNLIVLSLGTQSPPNRVSEINKYLRGRVKNGLDVTVMALHHNESGGHNGRTLLRSHSTLHHQTFNKRNDVLETFCGARGIGMTSNGAFSTKNFRTVSSGPRSEKRKSTARVINGKPKWQGRYAF